MRERLKRILDVSLASATLVATSPLIAAAAAAIKLESAGPVLFVQTRVGRNRRQIRTIKLRTMTTGHRAAPEITAAGDSRITKVGRWLRRTKIDELPQLWNVIRGDMSLVGPRPEVPKYVDLYRPEWQPLLEVRPGLTDVASLTFRNEEQLLALAHDRERAYRQVIMPLKLQLALDGVARSTISNDLQILLRTALAVIGVDAGAAEVIAQARADIERLNRGESPR